MLAPQGLLRSSKYFYESNCLTSTFHTRILGIHSAYGLARKPDFKLLELATTIDGVTPDQSRRIGLFCSLEKSENIQLEIRSAKTPNTNRRKVVRRS
jgi:hypothetical protein